jgi:transcriptional regulator, RpiR family
VLGNPQPIFVCSERRLAVKPFQKNLVPLIESSYDGLTLTEQEIADFFIKSVHEDRDFSAEKVAEELHVSVSTLTRFAQKCGFSGYRQFIFEYESVENSTSRITDALIQRVMYDYEELINKTYSLVDEEQFSRITSMLREAKRVYIYGKGSSGLVSREMKLRFMRIGLICEAITEEDMMRMNHILIDPDCVVIGLTVSGKTKPVLEALHQAKNHGAKTVLLTTNHSESFSQEFDEVLLIAQKKTLSQGNKISPQFPLLIMVDIFYAYFRNSDTEMRQNLFQHTLDALNIREEDQNGKS